MDTIAQSNRYLPHELKTRYHSVKFYRGGNTVAFVCRQPLSNHPNNAYTKQKIS